MLDKIACGLIWTGIVGAFTILTIKAYQTSQIAGGLMVCADIFVLGLAMLFWNTGD